MRLSMKTIRARRYGVSDGLRLRIVSADKSRRAGCGGGGKVSAQFHPRRITGSKERKVDERSKGRTFVEQSHSD